MQNFYEILGVGRHADAREIKRAYFLMAKKYHPDSGDQKEVKKFYEITQAYKKLSNPEERRIYDLSLGTEGAVFYQVASSAAPRPHTHPRSRATHGQDAGFRARETARFRRQRFFQAIAKVLISTLVAGVAGNTLGLILAATPAISVAAGAIFGFFWSINRSFDLTTFIAGHAARRFAFWGSRSLMTTSVLYFVAVFVYNLLAST